METTLNVSPHAGIVTKVVNNQATVRFTRGKMCAHCGACLAVGEKELELTVENTLGAEIGDAVSVSIPSRKVVQASLLAYLIPLACLLIGVGLGSLINDVCAMVFGIVGCGAAFLILRLMEKQRKKKNSDAFLPRMTSIVEKKNDTKD